MHLSVLESGDTLDFGQFLIDLQCKNIAPGDGIEIQASYLNLFLVICDLDFRQRVAPSVEAFQTFRQEILLPSSGLLWKFRKPCIEQAVGDVCVCVCVCVFVWP
jgi:hypothetical protein